MGPSRQTETQTPTQNTNSPTPTHAANGNGNSSSGRGRGRGRTGAATETLGTLLGFSMLVRLRARPANLLNGAKFFSISISSCRLLTFCGCYSSCFCQWCCCCWCVCVCVCVCWLPAAVVCVVRVAKYLHSNSIGCVLCLLPFARCCQNWKRWTLSQVFSIFSMSSAALPQRADRAVSQVSWPGELCTLPSLSLLPSLVRVLRKWKFKRVANHLNPYV